MQKESLEAKVVSSAEDVKEKWHDDVTCDDPAGTPLKVGYAYTETLNRDFFWWCGW
jgi:hypothetical protein